MDWSVAQNGMLHAPMAFPPRGSQGPVGDSIDAVEIATMALYSPKFDQSVVSIRLRDGNGRYVRCPEGVTLDGCVQALNRDASAHLILSPLKGSSSQKPLFYANLNLLQAVRVPGGEGKPPAETATLLLDRMPPLSVLGDSSLWSFLSAAAEHLEMAVIAAKKEISFVNAAQIDLVRRVRVARFFPSRSFAAFSFNDGRVEKIPGTLAEWQLERAMAAPKRKFVMAQINRLKQDSASANPEVGG